MHESGWFDALGFSFRVHAEDPRFIRYVSELFADLATFHGGRHHYEFSTVVTPGLDPQCGLTLDGELMFSAAKPEELVSSLVQHVNRRAVEGCRTVVLHAAGVEHGGAGLIFPAAMEAGKSTLSAGLVRAGSGYLTDEAVAIDRWTLMAQPYPKPFSLDPGSWSLFSEFEPNADLASGAYKAHQWQVPAHDVGRLGGPCRVRMIAFPRYVPGAETELIPMSRSETVIELMENAFGFQVSDAGRA